MATKAPQARSFTVHEARSLRRERPTLWLILMVAVIAAVVSFQALTEVGHSMRLGHVAPLLPLAIDGFAIACSLGIVQSQAGGEPARKRASEWMGLIYAVGVSILGNGFHALGAGYPNWLKLVMSSCIPVIVAYGIHVYGRAQQSGISRHVLVDDPDRIQFGLAQLGEDEHPARVAAPARPTVRVEKPAAPARVDAPAARATTPQAPAQPAQPAPARVQPVAARSDQERAREVYDRMVESNPLEKPDAAAIQRELGLTCNPATPRRWVSKWWDETQADLGTPARPEIVVNNAPSERAVASA